MMKWPFRACSAVILLIVGCGRMNGANPPAATAVVYQNAKYGITFSLPASWRGYKVVMQKWEGLLHSGKEGQTTTKQEGALIVLRSPEWQARTPTQDIPILVFTRAQWQADDDGRLEIHAGGMEFELGHNDKYVYAFYSRFNADDSIKGWKEASDIMGRNLDSNTARLSSK